RAARHRSRAARGGAGVAMSSAHDHTDECAELYAAWRRYDVVAEDASGAFTLDERLAAARERDMFARQLTGLRCDPYELLALEDAAAAEDAPAAEGEA